MKAVETFDMLPRECVVLLLQNALQRPQDAHVVERCMHRLGNVYVCKAKPRNLNPKPDALVVERCMRRLGNMYVYTYVYVCMYVLCMYVHTHTHFIYYNTI